MARPRDPSAEPVIDVRGLVNRFGAQIVHDGLNLQVWPGEILGVVGGSGSGKSVLMRSIIGLRHPDGGEIRVLGQTVTGGDATQIPELTRQWGVLFQGGALFSGLTVAENIQVPLREYFTLSETLMEEIAAYKIAMVGLPPEAGPKYPSELSGGMRKRAALARALALDPRLLFLDEPTAGLDPISADGFDTLIRTLADTMQLTVFLITHDLDTLHAICDRVAVIADRKIIACGTVAELARFEHPWVQEYFGGPRGRAAAIAQHHAPLEVG
jgi:phospholipid/cholesterol/gamma-HCH transport system ATP-binding protein